MSAHANRSMLSTRVRVPDGADKYAGMRTIFFLAPEKCRFSTARSDVTESTRPSHRLLVDLCQLHCQASLYKHSQTALINSSQRHWSRGMMEASHVCTCKSEHAFDPGLSPGWRRQTCRDADKNFFLLAPIISQAAHCSAR